MIWRFTFLPHDEDVPRRTGSHPLQALRREVFENDESHHQRITKATHDRNNRNHKCHSCSTGGRSDIICQPTHTWENGYRPADLRVHCRLLISRLRLEQPGAACTPCGISHHVKNGNTNKGNACFGSNARKSTRHRCEKSFQGSAGAAAQADLTSILEDKEKILALQQTLLEYKQDLLTALESYLPKV